MSKNQTSPTQTVLDFVHGITNGLPISAVSVCNRMYLAEQLIEAYDLDSRNCNLHASDLSDSADRLYAKAYSLNDDDAKAKLLNQAKAIGHIRQIIIGSGIDLHKQDKFQNRLIRSLKELREVIEDYPDMCEVVFQEKLDLKEKA